MAATPPDDPMDDTPADPGSRLNPVLLSDSPPKRKGKRSILESRSRSAVMAARMGESDALPMDVPMEDATPSAPGSRFNPFLLPDSPPKRKAKRILASASRTTMAAVHTRIGELAAMPTAVLDTTNVASSSRASTSRASTSRASTSRASTSRASTSQASTARNDQATTSHSPRPRRAILALEASLQENRTARTVAETRSATRLRNMGPAAQIPRGDQDDSQGAARAGRREEAYLTRGVNMMIAMNGYRPPRETKLQPPDLWKNGRGPPHQDATEDHHRCSICLSAKSHPVSYTCGHSHCFACIRVWLEYNWTCPDCVTKMYLPPFRNYAEEAALALAYPQWQDSSEVDYSFEGLIFPKQRRRAYAALAPFPAIE
ncbi:hypothetical protein C8R47DRAFT_1206910 [Mycena vitilis]|nr:hypothetical protein C8R47DRAFT_1206910 [Mycena vitilis]